MKSVLELCLLLSFVVLACCSDASCNKALNTLQSAFNASILSNGESCSDFVQLWSENATMNSPSWQPYHGSKIYDGCLQFALPEAWRSRCTQGFTFVYTNTHSADNNNKMWCVGTGVFTIIITNSTGSTCMVSSQETDTVVVDLNTNLFDYASTVYDYNGFGRSYLECGTRLCVF